MPMKHNLSIVPGVYAVIKLEPNSHIPTSIYQSSFYCISESTHEISIICEESFAPAKCIANRGWKLIKFEGSMDDCLVGVVARIAKPLADDGIGIIVHTTYDAGYFGVKHQDLRRAEELLADLF